MEKIIDGRRYNTRSANLIYVTQSSSSSSYSAFVLDDSFYIPGIQTTYLYRKSTGEFFLYICISYKPEGSARLKYSHFFEPLSFSDASVFLDRMLVEESRKNFSFSTARIIVTLFGSFRQLHLIPESSDLGEILKLANEKKVNLSKTRRYASLKKITIPLQDKKYNEILKLMHEKKLLFKDLGNPLIYGLRNS